jgi:hypothetical protein
MDPVIEAVMLLLEQQSKHGDAVFSERAKRSMAAIDKEYEVYRKMREKSGLRGEPTPPAEHVGSTLDEEEKPTGEGEEEA